MGQYKDLVEKQRKLLEAEEWAKKVKYILGDQNGFKIEFNDGSYTLETPSGKMIETEPTLTIEECVWQMEAENADRSRS